MLQIPSISDNAKAFHYIQTGRVVAFPTNTTYGLAVDALQGHALQRLRNLKQRSLTKTFTVFLKPKLHSTFFHLSSADKALISRFTSQAVTILLRPTSALEHLAENGYVGLRCIDHPLMAALANIANRPLTATSANIANQPPCLTPYCLRQTFPWQLDDATYDLSLAAILGDEHLPPSLPSTIIRLKGDSLEVVRPGAVTIKTS